MGWADRTGGELYHCWYNAPKAGTALVQIGDSEKTLPAVLLKKESQASGE
jgi:hypothetical protein